MTIPNKNLRVATYHWEYNGNDPDREMQYHFGLMDKEKIQQYCNKYSIVPLLTLVEDFPQSPEEYDKRPVLKELFELAENKQIDLILINGMHVFDSNFSGFQRIVWKLQTDNVQLRCVDEPFSVHVSDGCLIICPEEDID